MSDTASPLVNRAEPVRPLGVAGLSGQIATLLPGLLRATALAACAFAIRAAIPGGGMVSPLILAIVLGLALGNTVPVTDRFRPGITFAMRHLLRLAIVLLGLQLTLRDLAEVGFGGIAILASGLVATFLVTLQAGRLLGVDRKLTELLAAGTSICGAAAIIAANTVTRASDEDVAYAIATITVFGTIAMFAIPALGFWIGLDAHDVGFWAGAAIHEIAQVGGAAFQVGEAPGEFGMVAKLGRVMMLAPVVFALAFWASARARRETSAKSNTNISVPLPWFVLGFLAMVLLNSVIDLPPVAVSSAGQISSLLLAMALAAMGLQCSLPRLFAKGWRPLALGAISTVFIALATLSMIVAFV